MSISSKSLLLCVDVDNSISKGRTALRDVPNFISMSQAFTETKKPFSYQYVCNLSILYSNFAILNYGCLYIDRF